MSAAIDPTLLRELEGLSGELLLPADPGYEAARRVQNGLIDKRPGLIVRCRAIGDIVASVDFARAHGFELSIRGGGHNVAGRAVTEGGLMIDLALMRDVEVDSSRRTARVGGGATWGDVDRATQPHGLAVTGGMISTTGVAGLTLGGGRDVTAGDHDDMTVNAGLLHAPDASGVKLAGLVGSHLGPARDRRERASPPHRGDRPSPARDRADRIRRTQLRSGRGLPARRPQLLEVELPQSALGRRDRHDY